LSAAEFDRRDELGLFAFHWSAHGVRYAIGREIALWRDAGAVVVVSGSRAHFQAALADDAEIVPVVITAAPTVLAAAPAGRVGARTKTPSPNVSRGRRRSASITPAWSSSTIPARSTRPAGSSWACSAA